jgi:hypothetical protein
MGLHQSAKKKKNLLPLQGSELQSSVNQAIG